MHFERIARLATLFGSRSASHRQFRIGNLSFLNGPCWTREEVLFDSIPINLSLANDIAQVRTSGKVRVAWVCQGHLLALSKALFQPQVIHQVNIPFPCGITLFTLRMCCNEMRVVLSHDFGEMSSACCGQTFQVDTRVAYIVGKTDVVLLESWDAVPWYRVV